MGHLPIAGETHSLPPTEHRALQNSGYESRGDACAARYLPGDSTPASRPAATRSECARGTWPASYEPAWRRLLAAISRTFELEAHPQRQVLLFVDNDRAHDAKPVRNLLAKYHQRIQIEWLPAYSPELNPQEDIWQHMRRRVTHNHYFEELDALLQAVNEFHQQLEDSPKQVLRLISKWTRFISS